YAASVGASGGLRGARRWVWAVAAIGSATFGAAVAVRFAEGEYERERAAIEEQRARAAAAAAPAAPLAPPVCPEGSVLLAGPSSPGGAGPPADPLCMGRAEVTVAEYERCRQRGACDALDPPGEAPEAGLSPELRQHARQVYGG